MRWEITRNTQWTVLLEQSRNISLLPVRFVNSKHNFRMYFCDYNLTNRIKCIKKSRPNFSSALFASSTASLLPFLQLPSESCSLIFLLNFLQSLCKCWVHNYFSLSNHLQSNLCERWFYSHFNFKE